MSGSRAATMSRLGVTSRSGGVMVRGIASVLLLTVVLPLILPASAAVGEERRPPIADGPLNRDQALIAAAVRLVQGGDTLAAVRTLGQVRSPHRLAEGVEQVQAEVVLRADASTGMTSAAGTTSAAGPAASTTASAGDNEVPYRGGGGADFVTLMHLLQTTIAPDSWSDMGGPGTMVPYPAGIMIDPSGLVTDIDVDQAGSTTLENLVVMLARDNPTGDRPPADVIDAWRLPASLRCVSLRGLSYELARHRLAGRPIPDAVRYLAGLSRVRWIVLAAERDDVLLIGNVGGVESHQGWMRDAVSGRVAMRSDFLATCLVSAATRTPLGCTIDPSAERLNDTKRLAETIRDGQINEDSAVDRLRETLGDQSVRVFGIPGDTAIAYLMVEADRHMKRLALGLEPMPDGAANYLNVVARQIRRGPPDGQLLRLWFTASPLAVRQSTDGRAFEIAGNPMRLQSQTRLTAVDDQAAADDPRIAEFAAGFDQHLDAIIRRYPIYGGLESIYHAAAVAELIRRSESADSIGKWVTPLLLDDASAGLTATPQRIGSIAVGHSIRHRGNRHFVLIASGGVRIDPSESLSDEFISYPPHDSLVPRVLAETEDQSRWWWNLAE